MTSFVFRETLMTHLLLWGNAFAQVVRNGLGEVIGLYPLQPNRMSVGRDLDSKALEQGARVQILPPPDDVTSHGIRPYRMRGYKYPYLGIYLQILS